MMNLFKVQDSDTWQSVNDVVMGGVSNSRLTHVNKLAVFSGCVSMENNGGFASVKRRVSVSPVSQESVLHIRVMGDGKRYQLRVKQNSESNSPSYGAGFSTQANIWQQFEFRLSDFKASLRGKRLTGAAPLLWTNINQLGFLIGDSQRGDFCLLIDNINLQDD